jgi:hypothetical protein
VTRSQVALLVGFVAVIGGIGAVLWPTIQKATSSHGRRPTPSEDSGEGEPGRGTPRAPPTPPPEPPTDAAGAHALTARLDGSDVDAASLRFSGLEAEPGSANGALVRVRETGGEAWVKAPRAAWTRVPRFRATDTTFVDLVPAAAPLALRLFEADGLPASNAPVALPALGPDDGLRRTDATGVLTIDDRPAGLTSILAGGVERAGPRLRVVLGRDREATASLAAPWTVTGRVLSEDGSPVVGARVSAVTEFARDAGSVPCAPDGTFRWTGRFEEATVFVARAPGREDDAVEPPLPDPRGALRSAVDFRVRAERAQVAGRVTRPAGRGTAAVTLSVEPAVSAILREWFGPDSVLGASEPIPVAADGSFARRGLWPKVPVRLQVRGDVVPEDHLVDPSEARARAMRIAPAAASTATSTGSAATVPAGDPPPEGDAVVSGRVVDAFGEALVGVAVVAGTRRSTTDPHGAFRIGGLPANRRVTLAYGWADGASPGKSVPSDFVPAGTASVMPSQGGGPASEPTVLVLARAAGLSFRLLSPEGGPLSWARIVVLDGDGEVRYDDVVVPRDGKSSISGLTPGPAGRMTVLVPGLRRDVPLALAAGKTVDVGDVILQAGGRVKGDVRDRAGKPVAGAHVALVEDAWLQPGGRHVLRERDLFLRRTVTAADGTYELAGLETDRPAVLGAWAEGFAATSRRVLWTESLEARMPVVLARGARIRVRLVDEKDEPVAGVAIDLEDARRTGSRLLDLWHRAVLGNVVGSTEDFERASRFCLQEQRDAPGTYELGPAEPGPYDLVGVRPGFRPLRIKMSIPDDEPEQGASTPFSTARIGVLDMRFQMEAEAVPPAGGR